MCLNMDRRNSTSPSLVTGDSAASRIELVLPILGIFWSEVQCTLQTSNREEIGGKKNSFFASNKAGMLLKTQGGGNLQEPV